jgi:hypothetical protein
MKTPKLNYYRVQDVDREKALERLAFYMADGLTLKSAVDQLALDLSYTDANWEDTIFSCHPTPKDQESKGA